MADLARLVRAGAVGVAAYVALAAALTLLREPIDHVALLSTCLGVVVVGWYLYDAVERTSPPAWPAPPLPRDVPAQPTEYRARHLTTTVQHALQGQRLARADLAAQLADAVAERLVAHHGADPDDPLRDVDRHVSPGLAAWVRAATDGGTPPRARRAALTAHLKEIESL